MERVRSGDEEVVAVAVPLTIAYIEEEEEAEEEREEDAEDEKDDDDDEEDEDDGADGLVEKRDDDDDDDAGVATVDESSAVELIWPEEDATPFGAVVDADGVAAIDMDDEAAVDE